MKKRYAQLAIAALLPVGDAMAQTLNQANNAPSVGLSITNYQAGYIDPGSAGAGQTWDLSGLDTGPEVSLTYVTPASTGQASSFPGATIAASDGQGNYGFYVVNSNGQEIAGVYSATAMSAIPYQNTSKFLTYPCSYNTSWTDNFSSNYTISGISFTRSGTITGTADGFGTLLMPYGTVTNVLRVRTVEDYTDVSAVATIEYEFTNYYYYKPGTATPIAAVYEQISVISGVPQENFYSIWLSGGPVGILETTANAIGIELYPNPATEQVTVTYSTEGGSMQLELMDATGRLVRSEGITSAMGIGQHVLDVNGLPSGLYQVRITATNGQSGVQRLMVQ